MKPEQDTLDERYDKGIHAQLDGKWNMIFRHKMAVRILSGKKEEKNVKRRLKKIAHDRGLVLKIEPLNTTLPNLLFVTFEKIKEK